MATTPAQQPTQSAQIYIYKFNLSNGAHDPLELFPTGDLNNGEEAFLARYGFEPVPGGSSSLLTYYQSMICRDKYLCIAKVEKYALYFYIHDAQSLLAFRRRFGDAGSMLLGMVLPPEKPPIDLNASRFTMDTKKAYWS